MLKLERRNQNIHITLQGREPLLSRPFLTAFCVALGLHLIPFLLIHVRPIITHAKEIFLLPVIVNARIEVLTNLKEPAPHNPFEPTLPIPSLPDMPQLICCREPDYPFQSIIVPDLGYQEKPLPLTITVSGPLAAAPLFKHNLPEPRMRLREKCAVKVDNQTGKVFWSDTQNPTTEAILNALFFATVEPITSGTIEVAYD